MDSTERSKEEILDAITEEPLLKDLPEETRSRLAELVEQVTAGQERLNLTAIRDPLAMVRYHLADSLALLRAFDNFPPPPESRNAIDIGTGGGFPLLPMALTTPHLKWVGVDSVRKKTLFVQETAGTLNLENVEVIADRAENLGRGELRESADIVTARAVGAAAALLEVGIPMLRVGGKLFLFKTDAVRSEWENCSGVLELLGARDEGTFSYRLEGDDQERLIFIAEKIAHSPEQYPRREGVPFRKPLSA